MELLQLPGKFRGAAIVARAENEVQQLLERGSVTRRTPQNGFQQTDSFLGQPITGKEIDIGQRLSDELLRFVIEIGIGGISRRLSLDSRRLYFRRQFGSSLFYQFNWQSSFFLFLFMLGCCGSFFLDIVP